MADKSVWLGACAAKGKTTVNARNTANALACFRTIVLHPSYLHFSLARKSPRRSNRFAWDAVGTESVSLAMRLHADGRATPPTPCRELFRVTSHMARP